MQGTAFVVLIKERYTLKPMKKIIEAPKMSTLLVTGILAGLLFFACRADDLDQQCISDDVCETGYVEEILEQCKDCATHAPEIRIPSNTEVFFRKWGISLLYKYHEYKYWIAGALFCTLYYKYYR